MSDFRWTRPETVSYPGGAIRTERYDALQRTRQITVRAGVETRMDWRYTYDPVGNISRIDTEHGRYSFGYDALDRLTEADYLNGPQHDQINASFAPNTFPFADDRYAYDPVGNRLSSQSQPGPWAYNGNHELQQSPFGTTTFNLAGSTTEERTPTDQLIRRFTYDTEERPVEVSNAQGQRIARYYHDPFGRRLWKTLEPGAEGHSGGPAPETVYLAYSDEGYAAEFRIPGTPETAPTTGPASFTTIWVHEPDGLWSTGAIAMKTANGWRYLQHDHLATPRMVIDGQGAITTTIRMNAFGETRHQGEAIANRFPGQLYDAETGLHYNWFRSYEARAGRYTQADPIGYLGSLTIFGYASANSLAFSDPDGLLCIPMFAEKTDWETLSRRPLKVQTQNVLAHWFIGFVKCVFMETWVANERRTTRTREFCRECLLTSHRCGGEYEKCEWVVKRGLWKVEERTRMFDVFHDSYGAQVSGGWGDRRCAVCRNPISGEMVTVCGD